MNTNNDNWEYGWAWPEWVVLAVLLGVLILGVLDIAEII